MSTVQINAEWNDVFTTGKIDSLLDQAEPCSNEAKALACATALEAWANCMMGNKPPENFGLGMIALAKWSGLSSKDLMPENAGAVACRSLAEINARG